MLIVSTKSMACLSKISSPSGRSLKSIALDELQSKILLIDSSQNAFIYKFTIDFS